MKNSALKIASTYAGAIIGAGFASGQELVQFFVNYGFKGFLGILLAGFGFSFLGVLIVQIVVAERIQGYEYLFKILLGNKIGWLIQIWVSLTLFIGLSIMLAGCGSIFKEQFHLPYLTGIIISMIAVGVAVSNGEKGLLNFNMYLVPILIIITLIISLLTIVKGNRAIWTTNINPLIGGSWLKASLLYLSYNIVTGSVILSSLTSGKLSKSSLVSGCIMGGISLGFLGLIMVAALMMEYSSLLGFEIPMLFIAGKINKLSFYLYGVVLWFAMLTTAAANAFCLVQKAKLSWGITGKTAGIAIIIGAFPVTMFGFQGLIANFYPVFGYVGLILVAAVILYIVRNKILLLTSKR